MDDTIEKGKIKEARYLILIPLVITVICGWLDIWTTYANSGYNVQNIDAMESKVIGHLLVDDVNQSSILVYETHNKADGITIATTIIRCVMGYLVPSLLSIVIAMIWQKITYADAAYGVDKKKVGRSIFSTIIYATVFITCLIKYNIGTAIVGIIASVLYVREIYKNCIDEKIKPKKKNEMTADELMLKYINKVEGNTTNEEHKG